MIGTLDSEPNIPNTTIPKNHYLEIPEIGFGQEMVETYKIGKDIQVPESKPAYYSENQNNLFILGHNNSVFPKLIEKPSYIRIYNNDLPTTYYLQSSYLLPIAEISMHDILTYNGVVIMTCAGEKTTTSYTHRLILYYR